MNIYFAIAGFLSVFNAGLHFFAGGKSIARPLLDATSLTEEVRYVLYFCWHIATLALLAQAILFGVAAIMPDQASLAVTGTALAGAIALLGISIPLFVKTSYKTVPQGWLFVPVTLLGLAGLLM